MEIIAFEPENQRLRHKFIQLPYHLYQHDPNWSPPLRMDIRQIFNRKKHGFYKHGETHFLLALQNGEPVGRLVMLNNHGMEKKTGHFFLFEVENNFEIAAQLFNRGVAWAKSQGLTKLFGPKGMTPLDGMGLLVRGFEHCPAFGMPYNPEYYPEFYCKYGFTEIRRIDSGYISTNRFTLPEKVQRAANLIQERKGFHVMRLHKRKELRKAIQYLGEMYNAALTGTEGNASLTEYDLRSIVQVVLWIAKPELIKLIFKEDQPVGFLLAYPDVTAALHATGGRILPFGWINFLWEKHHSNWININGIGIADAYRGMAATALLFSELYQSVTSSRQFKHAEVIQISTENERMHLELQGMGINFYKTHAMYELEI